MKKPDPYMTDEENPEWTAEDFKRAVPARLLHPDLVEAWEKRRRGQRGSQKQPVKEAISLRVDQDVLATFRATGEGWQSRMNAALRIGAERLGPFTKKPVKKRSRRSQKRSPASKQIGRRDDHSIGRPT
jgi:uncharacterized protein (DUF4415 family)